MSPDITNSNAKATQDPLRHVPDVGSKGPSEYLRLFEVQRGPLTTRPQWIFTAGVSLSVTCDILITGSLCYWLHGVSPFLLRAEVGLVLNRSAVPFLESYRIPKRVHGSFYRFKPDSALTEGQNGCRYRQDHPLYG